MMSLVHLLSMATAARSASAYGLVPSPYNLWMDAINTRYILRWDWNSSTHNNTASFETQYKYSHETIWSRTACEKRSLCCDLSSLLAYSGSYVLRVKARVKGENSAWRNISFTPDEDALLGPPSLVDVAGGMAMITVSLNGPLTETGQQMSSIMSSNIKYRVKYWERDSAEQVEEKADQHFLLQRLKAGVEYCLRVCAFSFEYGKNSTYTDTRCIWTQGSKTVWHIALSVFAGVICLFVLGFIVKNRIRKCLQTEVVPVILMNPPLSHCSLLQLGEQSFAVMSVVGDLTKKEHWILGRYGEVKEKYFLAQDSGMYSGDDSANSSSSSHQLVQDNHIKTPEDQEECQTNTIQLMRKSFQT
uniref:Uncharacterized protein n=2 Tax=Denticeps clupeoides TaxID=299321 RepID=A0AAY4AS59_9TELE